MKIDARKKPCPQPVIETMKAMKDCSDGETIEVIVDNDAAVENLTRMAQKKNCQVSASAPGPERTVTIIYNKAGDEDDRKNAADEPVVCVVPDAQAQGAGTVVAIATDHMGQGDEKLGQILVKGFIYSLSQLDQLPKTILFFNSGAKLTTDGSESLADIRNLADRGVNILTCGTCLDYYGIKDKLAVGEVTNMYVITQTLMEAGKVIRI